MRDLGKYVDKWIAIIDRKVVASGNVGKEVLEGRSGDIREPLSLKVPSSAIMLM